MTNVEALRQLYAALGGEPANVANATTIVEVLNAIAAKFDGEDTATINPDAIANIAAVAGSITPKPKLAYGYGNPSDKTVVVYPPEGADGLLSVSITAVNSKLEPTLIPENIKSGVTIFGVTGTYDGT